MQSKTMKELWQDSYLSSGNEGYLEELYEEYLIDPQTVPSEWRQYFDQLIKTIPRPNGEASHALIQQQLMDFATLPQSQPSGIVAQDKLQEKVSELIDAYRRVGHLKANIDPLQLAERTINPMLELSYYGFKEADLDKEFSVQGFLGVKKDTATLREIYAALEQIYCRTIGFEYMHINRPAEVEWLRERIEKKWGDYQPSAEEKKHILDRLVVADGLEKYLGFKYVGQKRFSLEGDDSLIPMLDALMNKGAEHGIKEAIIGMAHRGRLNVLVNIAGQDPKAIFSVFEGTNETNGYSGDVKYHLGYASNVVTKYGTIHVAVAFNPSHLEIVSPVVQGSVRARQRRRKDTEQYQVVPIQLHGDAAFAGQGVVTETFNMSQARWFKVGGSIHIVVNNQIGFTTSDPNDSRSTIYCTDVAKMVAPPIFHINAEDPEAAYYVAIMAMDYRQKFKRDVVIDLIGFRRHGHNEADEPSATQPIMYQKIKSMQPTAITYAEKLTKEGVIHESEVQKLIDNYRAKLDAGKPVVELNNDKNAYEYLAKWDPFIGTSWKQDVSTAVPLKTLQDLAHAMEQLPDNFTLQPQVKKMMDARMKMTQGELPLNWGYAETLAYATLLAEGYPIRLCGQDSARGTFAHRHAVLHDQNSNALYIPLSHVAKNQAQINIVDSLLSEEAVLAFEYGYAATEPNNLVLWEAQFGDFANGAQVVIDQFISSGEQKWQRYCGLVMLLPHGFEGQGPEHSSARLERYLQLCAQDNMQVCVPTTPAQIFHLLRRQIIRPYRKPLIVMTPKSLLRHPLAVSTLDDLSKGELQLVIPEIDKLDDKQVTKVILCAGKIYFELLEARREQKLNVALIRVEQLYPFPEDNLRDVLKRYAHVKNFIWCQEEPKNQGAWPTIRECITSVLGKDQQLNYVGRPSAAAPAVGSHHLHEKEQAALVSQALTK